MPDSTLRLAIDLARTLFPYEARGRRAVRVRLPDGRQGIAIVAACVAEPGEQILVSEDGRHALKRAAEAGPADKVLLLVEPADGY
jgi:hypothetical protein